MAEAKGEAAEVKKMAVELSKLDIEGLLFGQNDSAIPTKQTSRSHREAGGSLQYRDHSHNGKSSICSGLDSISILFSSIEARITQTPFVTTPLFEEQSRVCSYYTVQEVMVVEPFSEPVLTTASAVQDMASKWNNDEDVFTTQWNKNLDEDEDESGGKSNAVTLSQLLDNVVILEESIKELVALIQARRSLGIDGVRYL